MSCGALSFKLHVQSDAHAAHCTCCWLVLAHLRKPSPCQLPATCCAAVCIPCLPLVILHGLDPPLADWNLQSVCVKVGLVCCRILQAAAVAPIPLPTSTVARQQWSL